MHLCLFEDNLVKNFFPLVHLRPVYDLRCGMLSLRARSVKYLSPASLTLHVREYLVPLVRHENPDVEINSFPLEPALFVNGRCIMSTKLAGMLKKSSPSDCIFVINDEVVAARLGEENISRLKRQSGVDAPDFSALSSLPRVGVEAELVRYPWDLVYANEAALQNDFHALTRRGVTRKGDIHKSAVLLGKKQISVGKKSRIDPCAVLVAENGPILIGDDVHIHAGAVIEGPCFIGDGSIVKIGAKIYGNTSIGPACKVGGEIEHAIVHSHSNKQHDGFLGHSYIGQWVNLGAGTTTSNLKNTYGNVKVEVDGAKVDTGKMFLGVITGDHVKTGINMSLDAGTVIGTSSSIYGSKLPSRFVRPFSWGESGNLTDYEVGKALAVAVKVMARRKVQASRAYQDAFCETYRMIIK